MNKIKVGILGATGIVGQKFVKCLSGHPFFEVVLLSASNNSAGKQYEDAVDRYFEGNIPDYIKNKTIIENRSDLILQQEVDLVFSALPTDEAKEIEQTLAKEGVNVFSNTSAHRMAQHVPILIPEINGEHLQLVKHQSFDNGFIVTNSNCSTSGFVFGLKPLMKFGLKSAYVTTYQSLSGAGRHGVSSLDNIGNIIPYIKNEEEKLESETKKILGTLDKNKIHDADLYINASCARVPVNVGHLESIIIELEEDIDVDQAKKDFTQFSSEVNSLNLPTAPKDAITVLDCENKPQPIRDLYSKEESVQGMTVTIGRLRKKGNLLNFFLLMDNTMRGAAGASILNAEFAKAKGFL